MGFVERIQNILYDLGGGNASGTSSSALGLVFVQRSDGREQVFIDVTQSDRPQERFGKTP
jgi:hypothetical protein